MANRAMTSNTQQATAAQVAPTFASLDDVLWRARSYLRMARERTLLAAVTSRARRQQMLLTAVANVQAQLCRLVTRTRDELRHPSRFFQVLPTSMPHLQHLPSCPARTEALDGFLAAGRSTLSAWTYLWEELASQCPPDCRTKDVLLNLAGAFTAAQRRLGLLEVESFDL